MKIMKLLGSFSLCLVAASMFSVSEASDMVWGEGVGLISATVSAATDAGGVPVRSGPSAQSEILAYMKAGTTIQGENTFNNGWVKLKGPVQGGWIRLSFLKPLPFEGTVIKVGQTDLCLPLKKGPGDAYENADCAQIGEMLKFSGVATLDGWLQLTSRNGWAPLASVDAAALTVVAATSREEKQPMKSGTKAASHSAQREAPPSQMRAQITEEAAAEEGEADGEAKACVGEWCVDFSNDVITREGKPQSFVDCARNATCALILAEFWVAVLEDEDHVDIPISSTTILRLSRDGTIRSASSDDVFANCSGASGPQSACVMDFLLELSKPIVDDLRTESARPGAADPVAKPTSSSGPGAQRDRPAAIGPGSKGTKGLYATEARQGKPDAHATTQSPTRKIETKNKQLPPSRSRGNPDTESYSLRDPFTDSFFDQRETQQEFVDERWKDTQRMGL